MTNRDTLGGELVGGGTTFKTTRWSVVLEAGGAGAADTAGVAMDQLCRTYWRPLYYYLSRRDPGRSIHDAQDCIQAFFADMLERSAFRRVDRSMGKFRSFLLASLNNFLRNQFAHQQAIKRGGRVEFISWEEADLERSYVGGHPQSAEQAFLRGWARAALLKAQDRLRGEHEQAGKLAQFEVLRVFLAGDKGELTYDEAGRRLGIGLSATKMAVLRFRRRFGELLCDEIAQTVSQPSEVSGEIRILLAALGS